MVHQLGILGGGQLGQMLALAATPLGLSVTVVDPAKDAPANRCARHVVAEYDSEEALASLGTSDVVTFEFENVPDDAANRLASAVPVFPSPAALRVSQDRLTEKNTFTQLGIATPRYLEVNGDAGAVAAFAALGPMVLKTRRFGYDGKGQIQVRTAEAAETAHREIGAAPAIAEALVPFDRELSVIVCRSQKGEIVTYPLSQNRHAGGILRQTVSPAPDVPRDVEQTALGMARRLAEHLDYVGVLALELFDVGGRLIANEFAPRVHNSGHHTIEGSVTSQFENHVRAVAGLPLGSTEPVGHAVMINLIGSVPDIGKLLSIEGCHVHHYGKQPRAGRKVGHVTVVADSPELARERAVQVLALTTEEPPPSD